MKPTIVLLAIIVLAMSLGGCTSYHQWTPMLDGKDLATDRIVRHEGVEIHVQRVFLFEGTGYPTAELRYHNGGRVPVGFGLDGFWLEIGDERILPILDADEFPSVYLEPGDNYNTRLTFDVSFKGDEAVVPAFMRLYLAPLIFENEEQPLPILTYRNPDD